MPTALAAICNVPVTQDIATLRYFIAGGASLATAVIEAIKRTVPHADVLEGWGMTETSGLCTLNPLGKTKSGSVGFPFKGVEIAIRRSSDDPDSICAPDEVGQLVVRGPSVIQGYQPASPASFTEDGWLRTGDLARLDADGYLWITGREKDVIIRGGHNIDPLTIEGPAFEHPSVRHAAAIGYPDRYAGELPMLYVELQPGTTASEAELLTFLRTRVVERAAMPKRVEFLATMPLTGPGKIAKLVLRAMATTDVYQAELDAIAANHGCLFMAHAVQDPVLGLVIEIAQNDTVPPSPELAQEVEAALSGFTTPFRWQSSR